MTMDDANYSDWEIEDDKAREKIGELDCGPFLYQSSWEQFKEQVSDNESPVGETRKVPSWTLAELDDHLAKMDEAWKPELPCAEYQACIDEGARIAAIDVVVPI